MTELPCRMLLQPDKLNPTRGAKLNGSFGTQFFFESIHDSFNLKLRRNQLDCRFVEAGVCLEKLSQLDNVLIHILNPD